MGCYSSGSSSSSGGGGSGNSLTTNAKAALFKRVGFTRYGNASYSNGGSHDVQVVKFAITDELSSIRVDTSASKSTIDEELYDAVVYIGVASKVAVADGLQITINSETYDFRVAKVAGVYDASVGLLYYELGLTRLES